MRVEDKVYTLNTHKQLVDLNGESTNFKATFNVTSPNPESKFNIVVVDQTTLDSGDDLEYKNAKGSISGTLVSDNNIYQNYFICLKTDGDECDVHVTIDREDVLPKQEDDEEDQENYNNEQNNTMIRDQEESDKKMSYMKIIALVLVLIVGGGMIWFFSKNKDKKPTSSSLPYSSSGPYSNLMSRLNA